MKTIYATKWLKKLFGAGVARKSDIEQAEELRYVLRYEDTAEFNITSIISNKLANIVCSDAGWDIIAHTQCEFTEGKKPPLQDFLSEGFRRCFDNLNIITARAFGIGGVILKPYIYNGAIYTDIIPQSQFFIIEQHGEIITKAGFVAETVERQDSGSSLKKTRYTRLEYHSLEDSIYTITNKIIACAGNESEGHEINLSESPFSDLPECASITGVNQMLFGFLKCPVDNRRDFSSIYGVPVTYGQEKLIKIITDLLDEIPDEYKNKRAFVGADDILFDQNAKLPKDGLYRLFRAMGSVDDKPFWEIFSPEIRHSSYFAGLDYLFGLLEKSICVNQGMLTDLNLANATATAIKRSMLDTFSTVDAMRRNIQCAFDQLVYSFGVIAGAFGLADGAGDYRIKFDWDYRLLEDTSETWRQKLEAYNAGAAELHELRMYIFGEDRATAQAAINSMSDAGAGSVIPIEDARQAQSPCPTENTPKTHELLYDGEICASKIFAPSGRLVSSLNPFRRESWDMGEQARIYRDNPEIAKHLMREARG